ncbi:lysophospholipid acyltransferase family protein [Sphingomonas bacterium]|uniref:lysophospholipid acyltransferase family protein n=1 Tax=Sphingomonas bacterium TaxID=1895847 RepID=UPI001575E513|nr:lysophospholipid acyltransferase family protein [Sphingomonas bacterium]
MRLAGRVIALALVLFIALLLHGACRLVRLRSPAPRLFLAAVARIVGARPRTIGQPCRRNVMIVSNHLSWLDIPLLAGTTGAAFVAKAELDMVPLVGWLCRLNATIFVARDDRLAIGGQVDRLRAALAQRAAVAIFPEGTTGDGTTLLPFKASLLAALDPPPPGVMVQPVRIDYGDATGELAWVGDESGRHHAGRVLRRRGTFRPTLRFCAPFDPRDFPGRKAIAAEARRRIAMGAEAGGEPPRPAV